MQNFNIIDYKEKFEKLELENNYNKKKILYLENEINQLKNNFNLLLSKLNNDFDRDNSTLFFKVWRNHYLKNLILNHVKLFKENNTLEVESISDVHSHPYKEYISIINYNINQPLRIVDFNLYKSLKEINLGVRFEQSILPNQLPNHISSIFIKNSYNFPLYENSLSTNLTTLCLNEYNDYITPKSLPRGLKYLKILKLKNLFMANSLPTTLEELSFGLVEGMGRSILPGILPNSILKLKITFESISTLKNVATKLMVGSIPTSVTDLELNFSNPLSYGIIPSSVTKLFLGNFDIELSPGDIPDSVIHLTLPNYKYPVKPGIFSKNIEYLGIDSYPHDFNSNFPSSIQCIYITQTITLKQLRTYPHPIQKFGIYKYNHSINQGSIPDVSSLDLVDFNCPLKLGSIPLTIKQLRFGKFNQPLKHGDIPIGVQILEFGEPFYQTIDSYCLPDTIHTLIFRNKKMKQLISNNNLPKSIKNIIYGY